VLPGYFDAFGRITHTPLDFLCGILPGAVLYMWLEEQRADLGFEFRATILGHVQRGGAPGAFDRLLGTRLGAAATEQLAAGRHGVLVGMRSGGIVPTPLAEVVSHRKTLDLDLLDLARVLAI
jgi:6-phosphofructokinase 1